SLDFKTLQLLRGGAGEWIRPQVEAEDALGAGQLHGEAFYIKTDDLARIYDPARTQHIKVGHEHRVQALGQGFARPADQAHDADLLDKRRAQVVSFNLFGINVLAR